MIGHTRISVIFRETEMFVTLKNLANLKSCPANHFFPSFLYLKSNSPTQATSSIYTDNQKTPYVYLMQSFKYLIIPTKFFKSYFNTKENIEQNVLTRSYGLSIVKHSY